MDVKLWPAQKPPLRVGAAQQQPLQLYPVIYWSPVPPTQNYAVGPKQQPTLAYQPAAKNVQKRSQYHQDSVPLKVPRSVDPPRHPSPEMSDPHQDTPSPRSRSSSNGTSVSNNERFPAPSKQNNKRTRDDEDSWNEEFANSVRHVKKKVKSGKMIEQGEINNLLHLCELQCDSEEDDESSKQKLQQCANAGEKRRRMGAMRARRSRLRRKKKAYRMELVAKELCNLLMQTISRIPRKSHYDGLSKKLKSALPGTSERTISTGASTPSFSLTRQMPASSPSIISDGKQTRVDSADDCDVAHVLQEMRSR